MAETLTATITAVYPPEGKRPYAILTDGQPNRIVTFKTPIGEAAVGLKGQFAEITYSVEEKNGYTNYYLEDVQPARTLDSELTQNGAEGVQAAIEEQVGRPQTRIPEHPTDRAEKRRSVAVSATAQALAAGIDLDDLLQKSSRVEAYISGESR